MNTKKAYAVEDLRKASQECVMKAKKASRLHASAARRYRAFPLLIRLFVSSKFMNLKNKMKKFEADRFNNMAVSMHLARLIRFQERRNRAPFQS